MGDSVLKVCYVHRNQINAAGDMGKIEQTVQSQPYSGLMLVEFE